MSRPPSIRHVQGTDCFFLGAFPTPIIVRRCLDIGVAEQFLHGDEIDVVIQHVACDSAMNDVNKDGHESLAAGQVGKQVADAARACLRVPPLRHGSTLWALRDL